MSWLERSTTNAIHMSSDSIIEGKDYSQVKSKYKIINENVEPIGIGGFGEVYTAIDTQTGEEVALKKIDKSYTDLTLFLKEMNALIQIEAFGGHPHIASLRAYYEDDSYYYIIFELIKGGEMFDQLVDMGAYSEADASRLLREVARALKFLHGIGVVHADLKPEHLMLSDSSSTARIKIVDFGCAEVFYSYNEIGVNDGVCVNNSFDHGSNNNNSSNTNITKMEEEKDNTDTVITPAYSPPEVLKGSLKSPSTDMWAMGVILYVMLTGVHPFDIDGLSTNDQIAHQILHYQSPPLRNTTLTKHLSESAIDLIERLLCWDEDNSIKRLTAQQMLNHPWIMGQTATTNILPDSHYNKLLLFRKFHSHYEAKLIHFSSMDEGNGDNDDETTAANEDNKNRKFERPLRSRLESSPY